MKIKTINVLMQVVVAVFFANSMALAQQIGMTRGEVLSYQTSVGASTKVGNLFTKENITKDLLSFKKGVGNYQFTFDTEDKCCIVTYLPSNAEVAKDFMKKLNSKFLPLTEEKWKGVENARLVEIIIYYIEDAGPMFVKTVKH